MTTSIHTTNAAMAASSSGGPTSAGGPANDALVIADRTFTSRLVVGTGKYPSHAVMQAAHIASGTEMVTVAVRRVDLAAKGEGSLLHWINREKIFLLPNTAGCYTADDAIRTARLGREAGLSNWVKLEVIGDEQTLFPDNEALIEATAGWCCPTPTTIRSPAASWPTPVPLPSCRWARQLDQVSAFRIRTTC